MNLNVEAAVLIEATTGQVLYQVNKDVPRPPASMAKMMTEYIVMESIKSGKIEWESQVQITEYAGSIGGSGQLLAKGETYSVRDLFRNMSIYSGNDASVALAEFIAGSETNFVELMNQTARELGMSEQAHFVNSTGLNKEDYPQAYANHIPNVPGETLMTAHDAALLAQAIVTKHPEVLEYSQQTRAYQREGDETSPQMINWNRMLEGWKDSAYYAQYAYDGLDGLKTGFTNQAGYCFTGTAERNGMRLISVVMGTGSEDERFRETRKLLDYGFNNFEMKTIMPAKSELPDLKTVEIKKGKETEVSVVTETGVTFIVGKGEGDDNITFATELLPEDERIAPIEQGDVLGKLIVTYSGITDVQQTVQLVAAEDVEKGSWFRLFFRAIKNFFVELFGGIKNLF
ncbi:D-alanyl-D-alanine carboxypeptidase [Xylanibacillus composti]|nr:D-alanyl-D-alanine carboxypeptidase [Xylanibacillus composti]